MIFIDLLLAPGPQGNRSLCLDGLQRTSYPPAVCGWGGPGGARGGQGGRERCCDHNYRLYACRPACQAPGHVLLQVWERTCQREEGGGPVRPLACSAPCCQRALWSTEPCSSEPRAWRSLCVGGVVGDSSGSPQCPREWREDFRAGGSHSSETITHRCAQGRTLNYLALLLLAAPLARHLAHPGFELPGAVLSLLACPLSTSAYHVAPCSHWATRARTACPVCAYYIFYAEGLSPCGLEPNT